MLPKLREGLSIKFSGYDHDSIPQWQIYDAGRNKFFVIGFPEYEILKRWYLKDPKAIIEAVNTQTTLAVDEEDLVNLVRFLEANYLIIQSAEDIYKKAKAQKIIKKDNLFYWFVRYYLFFRIPLFHADKFLTKTQRIANIIFHKNMIYFMGFLALIALYQIGTQWDEFKHTFSKIISWQGFVFYIIAFSIAKFFHELGHAYRCKQFGIPVPTLGVAFLVFWPVLYTDTTLSWSLPSQKRLRIALAGIWIETYVTIIAALLWANVHNVTIQMVCYLIITINWLTSLLINASPFMRFDGYYILSDLLKIPNLQLRAFALARWQIRNWLFGWEEPTHEPFSKKMYWILVVYSFITWIYRLIIYFGIALLVYHLFLKILGILLFGIELFVFILGPVVNELRVWYYLRKQFVWNKNLKITILIFSFAFLFLFLPINQSVELYATLNYKHEFLFSEKEGMLTNQPPDRGTLVEKNQIIANIVSPEINYLLNKTTLEYQKLLVEIRRAEFNPAHQAELYALKSNLSQKLAEITKLQVQKEALVLRAPFNGEISEVSADLYPGAVVMKDQFIVDVVDPTQPLIQAYVTQNDLEKIKLGLPGTFYPENLGDPPILIKVVSIEPLNITDLQWQYSKKLKQNKLNDLIVDTPSYLSSDFGGKIPTNITDKEELVPIDSVYRVLLVPEKPVSLKYIQRGIVILAVSPQSYVSRLFYNIKKLWIKETSF